MRDQTIRRLAAVELIGVAFAWLALGTLSPVGLHVGPSGPSIRLWALAPVVLMAIGWRLGSRRGATMTRLAPLSGFALAGMWWLFADHPMQGVTVWHLSETRGVDSGDLPGLVLIIASALAVDRTLRRRHPRPHRPQD